MRRGKTVRVREVAAHLGVAPATVRRLIREGQLVARKVPNRRGFITECWDVSEASMERLRASGNHPRGRGTWRRMAIPPTDDRTVVIPPAGMRRKLKRELAWQSWWENVERPEWISVEEWEKARMAAWPAMVRDIDREVARLQTKLWLSFRPSSIRKHEERLDLLRQRKQQILAEVSAAGWREPDEGEVSGTINEEPARTKMKPRYPGGLF